MSQACIIWVRSTLDLFKAKAETSNIFTRKSQIESLLYIFNENIGPGANTPWASTKNRFTIRMLKQGATIIKLKELSIIITHLGSPTRSLKYGMGRFEVISKHRLGAGIYLINLFQPVARYLKIQTIQSAAMHLNNDREIWNFKPSIQDI